MLLLPRAQLKPAAGEVLNSVATCSVTSQLPQHFHRRPEPDARTTNALINNDIHTINDLFALNDAELRDLKGFGSKALDEVKEKLAELEL